MEWMYDCVSYPSGVLSVLISVYDCLCVCVVVCLRWV